MRGKQRFRCKASLPDTLHQKKRRKLWVWVAVSRLTRRIFAIETGSRSAKTQKAAMGKTGTSQAFLRGNR